MAAWTEQENLVLRVYYAYADPDSLLNLLPRRSLSAIYTHAFQMRLKKTKWPKPLRPARESAQVKISKPKSEVIPHPIRFWAWEKQTLLEIGPRITVIEMKQLIPRKSIAQIRRMAEVFGVKFLGD